MRKKILRQIIFLFALVIMLTGSIPASAAAPVKLNKTKITLNVKKSYQLKVSGTKKKIKWSSSKKSVATVNKKGKVTAKKKGTAIITAKAGKTKYTCKVTVRQPVTSVKLNKKSVTLKKKGASVTLKAKLKPSSANNKTVTWTTSNKKVATVNAKGKVTAVGNGKCTITAVAKDGSKKKASCKITVKIPVVKTTKLTLNKSKATLTKKGQTLQLTAAITPKNATNKTLTWKSSNTKTATVSKTGKVTAVGNGTATITVAATDGSRKSAACKVTVNIPDKPAPTTPAPTKPVDPTPEPSSNVKKATGIATTDISVDYNETQYMVGDTITLKAVVQPSNATDKRITWTSSDPSVATIDANGKITMQKPGTCNITAAAYNWGVPSEWIATVERYNWTLQHQMEEFQPRASVSITVTPAYTQLDEIHFDEPDGFNAITEKMIGIGSTKTMPVRINTAYTAPKHAELVYRSENTSIATVDQNGVITGKAKGYVRITVTTKYPKADGTYPKCAATYRIGAYTYEEILNDLTWDMEASKAAHEYLNHIRTTPEDRVLPAYQTMPAVPAREWEQGFLQKSVVRASRDIVCTIIGGWKPDEILNGKPLAYHGGMQNGFGGAWTSSGSTLGTNSARGLTEDSGHMSNQLDANTTHVAIAYIRYKNPSGVNLTSMITSMSNVSYEQGKQNCTDAGTTVLNELVKSTRVPLNEYLDYCHHFNLTAG